MSDHSCFFSPSFFFFLSFFCMYGRTWEFSRFIYLFLSFSLGIAINEVLLTIVDAEFAGWEIGGVVLKDSFRFLGKFWKMYFFFCKTIRIFIFPFPPLFFFFHRTITCVWENLKRQREEKNKIESVVSETLHLQSRSQLSLWSTIYYMIR